jgi:hypothetical protein
LWAHEKFDPKKKVVVLITGWNTDIADENTAADEMYKAYRTRGDNNFILIDTARYVDTLYTWSAFNTRQLGEAVGKGLAELINFVPLESIHVMGHSLGEKLRFVGSDTKKFLFSPLCRMTFKARTSLAARARRFSSRQTNFCRESLDLTLQKYVCHMHNSPRRDFIKINFLLRLLASSIKNEPDSLAAALLRRR